MTVAPSHASFGDGATSDETMFATLVEQIRGLKPSALTSTAVCDDVLTVIEFLRNETIKQVDVVASKSNELTAREKVVAHKERMLLLRERAFGMLGVKWWK